MEIRVNANQHLNRAVQNAPKPGNPAPRSESNPNQSNASVISERLKAQMQNLRPSETEKQQLKDIKEAKEHLKLTSSQIVKQARTALLAQANATTQSAMALLNG